MKTMNVIIYLVLQKYFYLKRGHLCALPYTHDDIETFPTYEKALATLNQWKGNSEKIGYRLSDSHTGKHDPNLCYGCRMDNPDGHTVLFEICTKTVEIDLPNL